jgi:hypothetical protein
VPTPQAGQYGPEGAVCQPSATELARDIDALGRHRAQFV